MVLKVNYGSKRPTTNPSANLQLFLKWGVKEVLRYFWRGVWHLRGDGETVLTAFCSRFLASLLKDLARVWLKLKGGLI